MTKSISAVIEAAIEQERAKEAPERRRVPWKNSSELMLVVKLPLAPLKLNPNSHRIKAQLSAHPNRAIVEGNPFGDEAQSIITELLRATEGFEALKNDLEERGQADPGVVSREGVLVNANTRAVALRDLAKTHIDLLVLPPKATTTQISELELRLQVAKEFKQDYTFTNRLLFIRDCQAAGWSLDRIADEVHGTTGSSARRKGLVERDLRVLSTIDELIGMSGGRLSYPEFDSKAVALEELDKVYEDLKSKDAAAAIRLRTDRLVAILTGVGYRDVRLIEGTDFGDLLREEMEEDEDVQFLLDEAEEKADDPAGLDLLGGTPSADRPIGDALLQWLTKTAGSKHVSVPAPDGGSSDEDRQDVVEALQTAVEKAVETVRLKTQRGSLIDQPVSALKDAVKKLQTAETAYAKAKTDAAFVPQVTKLSKVIGKARRQLDSIEARILADFPPDAT